MNPEPPDPANSQAPAEGLAAAPPAALPEPAADAGGAPTEAAEAADATVLEAPAQTEPAKVAAPDLSPAATGSRLTALFPALFVGPDGKGVWKPIKLRIHADIQARAPGEFSKRTLGIFFSRYTTTSPYLKALAAEGAQRFDLDGQPAGEISAEHRQLATEEVARRQALAAERRAAHRPPRREPAPPLQPVDGAAAVPDRQPRHPPVARPAAPSERPAERPGDHPAQVPRRPREGGNARSDWPPQQGRDAPRSPGSERPGRPPRPADRQPRPHSTQHVDRAPQTLGREAPAAALPTDPAQRERAMLRRAFESSPLSKANFCALKGITESMLDAALAPVQGEHGKL